MWMQMIHCTPNGYLILNSKKSRSVYLYNGQLKSDQFVQYRVLDIDIGKKDLLQCADAAIKLKADFLFEKNRYSEITFFATSGDKISFQDWLRGTRWKEQGGKLISYITTRNTNNGSPRTANLKSWWLPRPRTFTRR